MAVARNGTKLDNAMKTGRRRTMGQMENFEHRPQKFVIFGYRGEDLFSPVQSNVCGRELRNPQPPAVIKSARFGWQNDLQSANITFRPSLCC